MHLIYVAVATENPCSSATAKNYTTITKRRAPRSNAREPLLLRIHRCLTSYPTGDVIHRCFTFNDSNSCRPTKNCFDNATHSMPRSPRRNLTSERASSWKSSAWLPSSILPPVRSSESKGLRHESDRRRNTEIRRRGKHGAAVDARPHGLPSMSERRS